MTLDESFTGTAEVPVKGRLEIRLKGQAGTGYAWELDRTPASNIKVLANRTETPKRPKNGPPILGGGNVQVFSFQAFRPGATRVEFVYRRSWIAKTPADKRMRFTIRVVPK